MRSWLACTFYHAHITKVLTSNTKSIWQFLLPFQTFRVNTEDTEKTQDHIHTQGTMIIRDSIHSLWLRLRDIKNYYCILRFFVKYETNKLKKYAARVACTYVLEKILSTSYGAISTP